MRLIIFVKIPSRVEPIPLDIIDDRPSQSVLNDILVIAKLSTKNETAADYYLSRNGAKIDPDLELSKNGVKNGTLLDLIRRDEKIATVSKDQFKEFALQGAPSNITEESESAKKTQKKSNKQSNVPGKKIDFD